MPLTQVQEDPAQIASRFRREHKLRVRWMAVNIEEMRTEIRYETRKFVVQIVAGLSAAFAAGVAVATLVAHLAGRL